MTMTSRKNEKPSLSLVIPTFNSAKTLEKCLDSIINQNYPHSKREIIIIDGGSTDKTIEIAKRYKTKIIFNRDTVEEKGRPLGIDNAQGEIIGFIDADNILPKKNFLEKIVEPFSDREIIISEPLFYSSTKRDNIITKYISLIGGDDPISIYLGIYDRFCYFKGKWTDSSVTTEENKKNYFKIRLSTYSLPPMGANGSFFRASSLRAIDYSPFLHTDIIYKLVKNKMNKVAKVKTGIIHLQIGGFSRFLLKKRRRIIRLTNSETARAYKLQISPSRSIILSLKIILIFPIVFDAVKGFLRNPSIVWVFHYPLTILTWLVYTFILTKYFIKIKWM